MDNKEYKRILINRSYKFSLAVMSFIDLLDKRNFSLEIIAKQIIRSATSIGANIVEAQAGSSRKDFVNFLNHALKSSNETRYWLGLLRDSGHTSIQNVVILLNEAQEISKILGSSVMSLKGKKKL